jgi:hypothetical protein
MTGLILTLLYLKEIKKTFKEAEISGPENKFFRLLLFLLFLFHQNNLTEFFYTRS